MRKVVLWGFVLFSVSILCFLNVTPLDRRILNPDDSLTTTTTPTKPMQVQVTNFPVTQNVGGTVNVGNLPVIQTVTGSVAVSNLPMDADGNLRTSIGQSGPAYQFFKLPGPIQVTGYELAPPPVVAFTDPIPVAGWKKASVLMTIIDCEHCPPGTSCADVDVVVNAFPEFGGDGVFASIPSVVSSAYFIDVPGRLARTIGQTDIAGPEMRVAVYPTRVTCSVDLWIYLSK